MARVFVYIKLHEGMRYTLNTEDSHHLKNVLRMKKNALVQVIDCQAREFTAEIIDDTTKQLILKIIKQEQINREPGLHITVFQGLPKGDKMEQVIMRCTEIGASTFIPVVMKRSIVNLKKEKAQKKRERWQKIAYSAACQSKRQIIPEVIEVHSFKQMIDGLSEYDDILLLYENEKKQTLYDIELTKISGKVAIIIGPEGGLTEAEVDGLKIVGARSISLGPRILRTETAAISAISVLLYCSGDLGRKTSEELQNLYIDTRLQS